MPVDYKKIYTQDYFNGKNSFFYKLGYGRFAKFYFDNLFKSLRPYLKKITTEGRVLDVGCAYGFMLERFPDVFEKFGIDISDYAIREARKRLPGVTFKIGNVEDELPFPEASFDIVICNDVIEHLENPDGALKNISKVLDRDGILFIKTPNLNWFRKKFFAYADKKEHHISMFSRQTLSDLLVECGFKIIDRWTFTIFPVFFLKFKSKLGIEQLFICQLK